MNYDRLTISHDFATANRGPDRGFVARERAKGTPDAAIARMGGWCVSDVLAMPQEPAARAFPRPERPVPSRAPPRRNASIDPEVAEILAHIAEQYEVTPEDILGHCQIAGYVEPRHEAFAVVWELNRYTADELGLLFNKTPNAITYGLRRHYERLAEMKRWEAL
jgi:hypothetical protein